jgi:transcriptional regulator with XRE-family HTH domain
MDKVVFDVDKFALAVELKRAMAQITISDLAILTNIGASTLYGIKAGAYAPSMAQFAALCSWLDLSPAMFFKNVKDGKNG